MGRPVVLKTYQELAEFRYRIVSYLKKADQGVRGAGLEPQQYVVLLALRGLPAGRDPSIRVLAERLKVRHHSAVGLVDRLERRGLVRRERAKNDRRRVLVRLTARGNGILGKVVKERVSDLHAMAPALVRALSAIVAIANGHGRHGAKKRRA
ncbi:MAG: MarR family transcriptional regulator [Candidatus Acidiferrales bacterium]